MRRRNNLYLMLLIFIMLTLAIIFCASILVIRDQSETMEQQQELEAVRIHEAQESTIELTPLTYIEPTIYKNIEASAPNPHEDAPIVIEDEPSYDGKGGLECEFKEDVERLACVIYQEAGGDTCCDLCRKRVADE